jgi:hypothetical protein
VAAVAVVAGGLADAAPPRSAAAKVVRSGCARLPVSKLLERFPRGGTRSGAPAAGERYAGSAKISHDLPDGPALVAPLTGDPPQLPDATAVVRRPVDPPNDSPIIGYRVLVVQPETGLRALPDTFVTAP